MYRLTIEEVLQLGFRELDHFTVANNLIYDLGRRRQLSIGALGTPNEVLYITEHDEDNHKKITDLVCLHNYDYDGYLTRQKLESLITSIGKSKK